MPLDSLLAALRQPPPVLAALSAQPGAYLVGGFLRDAYWGQASRDLDLAASPPLESLLEAVTRACGSAPFRLNARFQSYRAECGEYAIDITPLHADSIEADLLQRDYTINALAVPLSALGEGVSARQVLAHPQALADLDARRLRMVARANLADDPLRILRGYRLLAETELAVDAETRQAWRELAPAVLEPAPERIHEELLRILSAPGGCEPVLRLMAEDGALFTLLPPLAATQGCGQNEFHHLDVWEHTLLCLLELERLRREPPPELTPWQDGLAEAWARPVSGPASAGALTRLALLLHDAGKPSAREVQPDGRVSFYQHQDIGAELLVPLLAQLKFAAAESELVLLLIREHLRLGFYSEHDPLPPRLIYRFVRKLGRATPLAVLHALADCAATQGSLSADSWPRHVAAATTLLEHYFAADAIAKPPLLLDGHAIMRLLGLKPGRLVGRLRNALLEATAAGEVRDVAEAETFLRAWQARKFSGLDDADGTEAEQG
jgi:poly(A) polymerase